MALSITSHALTRMKQRGVSEHIVKLVLAFGRKLHIKGAVYYVIGRKEIKKYAEREPLLKTLEGLQVVTATQEKVFTILTVFKNKDFSSIR